jgi:hypothetical protein
MTVGRQEGKNVEHPAAGDHEGRPYYAMHESDPQARPYPAEAGIAPQSHSPTKSCGGGEKG